MRLASLSSLALLAALVAVPSAASQDATQDVRLRVVQNDAVAGGTLQISIESRTAAVRAPNTDLGSATIDVAFDDAELTVSGFGSPLTAAPGYNIAPSPITCTGLGGTCIRFTITTSGIGGPPFGNPGFEVGSDFTQLATLSFTHSAASVEDLTLVIDRQTLSVGYFDSPDNSSGNGVIEDNTGTVGDDVVAFETVQDLTIDAVTFGSENWHLVGVPGFGATVDDLVGPLFTQGFTGSDAGTEGDPNVAFWSETADAYVTPSNQSDALAPGVGLFVFAFADDDNDGTDDAFPKTSFLTVEPVNDLGSPVNNAAFGPNPYVPKLPFSFPVTFSAGGSSPGSNMLANPSDGTADWDAAGWVRTNVADVFYTWDPDNAGGAQYVAYSAGTGGTRDDGLIAPTEGFWVDATANGPVLIMPETAYVEARGDRPSALRLRVAGKVGGQALTNEVFLAFASGADVGRDNADARELTGLTATRLQLYTRTEGHTFDIDVRPSLADAPAEINLDLDAIADDAWASADLVLTWPEFRELPTDVPVQLLDTETGAIVDLRTAASYAFSVGPDSGGRVGAPAPSAQSSGVMAPVSVGAANEGARQSGDSRFVLFVGTEARAVATDDDAAASEMTLLPPAPNPVRTRTTLRYSLATAGPVRMVVYDVLGREVAVLDDAERSAGAHQVVLDAGQLAPGLYVVRLQARGQSLTQSLTVTR